MSTHNIGFYAEAILMSTHNIGFYEDFTKNIFELSSNIIKYAPYFFACYYKTSVASVYHSGPAKGGANKDWRNKEKK